MNYTYKDAPETLPVLVVGRWYRHLRAGPVLIVRRFEGTRPYYQVRGQTGATWDQNDFALLNQLGDLEPTSSRPPAQLDMFTDAP